MANRYSLLKMGERSLSGLKLALLDPDIRVRLVDDEPPSVANSILGMWVTGGFLDGQTMRFNENVSCFIGDTGSGKSLATELLRFGLDQQPRVPKIKAEVDSLLQQQLGNLGTVHVLLSRGGSHFLVERTWGNPVGKPYVQRLTEAGLEPIADLDIKSLFPIKGFSQSEIIEFARQPEVRLSMTDDLIDCSGERSSIEFLKGDLIRNAAEVIAENGKAVRIREQLEERSTFVESVRELDKVLTDPRIVQQQEWYREQTLLDGATVQISGLKADISSNVDSISSSVPFVDDIAKLPNFDLLNKVQHAFINWQDYVSNLRDETSYKLQVLSDTVNRLHAQWDERFEIAETQYHQSLEELDNNGIGIPALSERRRNLSARISELDEHDRELQDKILPAIQKLEDEREQLLTELQNNRRAITEKRKDKAKALTAKLQGIIRLRVHERASTELFENVLRDLVQGSYLQSPDIELLATNCHPIPLAKQLLSQKFQDLSEKSGLDQLKTTKIWDTITERDRVTDLYHAQLTDVEDIIEIQLQVEQGTYRRLEELSHGQKCMVVLMVALAEGDFPLLVDQPEDALHAPSIETGIVSALRSGRGARQCIFATRNANILVSADAEQIIALQADAQSGKVAGTGSLDRFDHRQLIIHHVEGGEEAFQRRQSMYTLQPFP